MKISATFARKVGMPGYCSVSASCTVETDCRTSDPGKVAESIRAAYSLATQAVEDHLASQVEIILSDPPLVPEPRPAAAAPPPSRRADGKPGDPVPRGDHPERFSGTAAWRAEHVGRNGRNKPSAAASLGAPRDGRQLFAWLKRQEESSGERLLPILSRWAKSEGIDGRVIEWGPDETAAALEYLGAPVDA